MLLSLALMVGLDQHQACEFAMSARGGLKGDTRHAGDFGQVLFKFVYQLNDALNGTFQAAMGGYGRNLAKRPYLR